jgi:hypothetical protein
MWQSKYLVAEHDASAVGGLSNQFAVQPVIGAE